MNTPTTEPETPQREISLLSLGDSYTIGTGVRSDDRFPAQLVNLLQKEGLEVTEAVIIAQNGWTTGELLKGISASNNQGQFDLVTLLIGVNNQFRGYDPLEYREEFRELLQIAISYASGRPERTVVISIPDWGAAPFARGMETEQISIEIDQFNEINRSETQAAGAHYLDITPLSREIRDDPTLVAEDGLHLSGKTYSKWAELVIDSIFPVLENQ